MKNGKEYEKRGRIRNGKMGFGEKQDFFGEGSGNHFNIWATKKWEKEGNNTKGQFCEHSNQQKIFIVKQQKNSIARLTSIFFKNNLVVCGRTQSTNVTRYSNNVVSEENNKASAALELSVLSNCTNATQ